MWSCGPVKSTNGDVIFNDKGNDTVRIANENLKYEIIILDHFSTYPPMLEYIHNTLQQQQEEEATKNNINITVIQLKQKNWNDALIECADLIDSYL